MATIISERMAAEMEGDFVVFAIGMRVNKAWKLHKWLPVASAMRRMLKERNWLAKLACCSKHAIPICSRKASTTRHLRPSPSMRRKRW